MLLNFIRERILIQINIQNNHAFGFCFLFLYFYIFCSSQFELEILQNSFNIASRSIFQRGGKKKRKECSYIFPLRTISPFKFEEPDRTNCSVYLCVFSQKITKIYNLISLGQRYLYA